MNFINRIFKKNIFLILIRTQVITYVVIISYISQFILLHLVYIYILFSVKMFHTVNESPLPA